MTALEILNLFSLPSGKKLHLQGYEIELLIERANEYKLSKEEMDNLERIIKDDIYYFEGGFVYNLMTMEKVAIVSISKGTKYSTNYIRQRIENKICINGIPYSYNKDENPLFFKIVERQKYFKCLELNCVKTKDEWKKYFDDMKLNVSCYIKNHWKYQGKYSFETYSKQLWEVL